MSITDDQDDGFIVKLRGLPWSSTVDEILKFFHESKIKGGKSGIHMTTSREGRPSGEAFIEFEDDEDVLRACTKDRDHMGNRYIEVFKVNRAEMDWVIKRSGAAYGTNEDGCVRLRGLPFGCSKEEIAQFFTGLEIVPNGITLLTDYSGRSSGEAYVQFVNKEVAEKALQKHREKIGHRYIEIFRSSQSEVNSILGYPNNRKVTGSTYRPSPYDRGERYGGSGGGGGGAGTGTGNSSSGGSSNGNSNAINRFPSRGSRSFKGNFTSNSDNYNNFERPWKSNDTTNNVFDPNSWSSNSNSSRASTGLHCIHMRGLPFKASQLDIADFFKPSVPVNINLLQDNSGRASGEADVEFGCHEDAVRGMSKDKGHMQHRYIELFLNSSPSGNANGGSSTAYPSAGRRRL